jgi:hypothetical protein
MLIKSISDKFVCKTASPSSPHEKLIEDLIYYCKVKKSRKRRYRIQEIGYNSEAVYPQFQINTHQLMDSPCKHSHFIGAKM